MSYLLKSRKKTRPNAFLVIAVFILGIVLLLQMFAPLVLSRLLMPVSGLFWKGGGALSLEGSRTVSLFSSKNKLIEENEILRSALLEQNTELLRLEMLQRENNALRALFASTAKNPHKVLVRVLAKPPQSPYDTIIVDGGSDDKISVGDKAIWNESTVVGEVSETYGSSSRVLLYSASGRETTVEIERTGVHIAAVGRGGGSLEIQAPKDFDVLEDDIVLLPGGDRLMIGIVSAIESNPADSFQTAFIKLPFNISEISLLAILP